jgi:hypothetical protein
VQTGPVIETYNTEDKVVEQTSDHPSKCFRLAYSAPCYRGKLFDDLGFIGDTECAQQILEGTYDFPLDTDTWTKKILQEANYTFSCMSGAEILTIITTTKSKISGDGLMKGCWVTFSHYKAAATNPMLSAIHAAYLTACARRGLPIARWGIGLTVLLDKVAGNNFVHKLRAICLLEADFNWINKIIFAKRMLGMALANDLILGECFSKKGSNCINAVITKVFIYDESGSTITMHALQGMIFAIVMTGQHTQLLLFHYNASEFPNLQLMFCLRRWRLCNFFCALDLEN